MFKKRYERRFESFDLNYESVTFLTSVPIFFILFIGIGLSLLILFCEKIHFRINTTYTVHHHKFAKSKTNYWQSLIRPVH
jgi:hypothetical protein